MTNTMERTWKEEDYWRNWCPECGESRCSHYHHWDDYDYYIELDYEQEEDDES